MSRLKVLFADDQIPPDEIPDNGIDKWVQEEYANRDEKFKRGFGETRKTVECLRVGGYHVTTARTLKEAQNLIQESHFDIAIIDLGWSADKSIPESQWEHKGWDIGDWIEKADTRNQCKTRQIIHSYKFHNNAALSQEAARRGILPIGKSHDEAGRQFLLAAIHFIASDLSVSSSRDQFAQEAANELLKMMIASLNEPLRQYKMWFLVTVCLVSLSVLVLIAAIAAVAIWRLVEISALTSISSIMINIVTVLLYRQLQRVQKEVKETRSVVIGEFDKAVKEFLAQIQPVKIEAMAPVR